MKTKTTIQTAEAHAANGNTEAALRILDGALRASLNSRTTAPLYNAKMRILDALVDATVARSQARRVAA